MSDEVVYFVLLIAMVIAALAIPRKWDPAIWLKEKTWRK